MNYQVPLPKQGHLCYYKPGAITVQKKIIVNRLPFFIFSDKLYRMKKIVPFITLLLLHQACKLKSNDTPENNKPAADVLAVNMDTTVKATEDFFLYANGGWIKKNAIPAEESSWGIGNLVIEENYKRLKEISEKAANEKE